MAKEMLNLNPVGDCSAALAVNMSFKGNLGNNSSTKSVNKNRSYPVLLSKVIKLCNGLNTYWTIT